MKFRGRAASARSAPRARAVAAAAALSVLTALAAPASHVVAHAQREPAGPQVPVVGSQALVNELNAVITEVGPPLTREPDGGLRLRATIFNSTPEPALRVRWRLRIAPPVTTRAGLTTPFDDRGTSEILWHDDEQVVDSLAAGGQHDVALYLPVDMLEAFPAPAGPAVFPIRFEVTHRLETTIATADTFLIWFPEPQPTLRLGWLVPITDPPARDANFAVRGGALEQSVSPGGRLHEVLDALDRGERAAGGTLPLTLAIDAQLVESVLALADGAARVAADGAGPAVQRTGNPAAAAWLRRLKARAAKHPVIALPYADADIVALVRAGLTGPMATSFASGRRVDSLLGVTSRRDIAWPAGEVVDAATAGELADNGIGSIVLDRQSVPRVIDRGYTTTAASDLALSARRITAIVPDAPVTSLAGDVAAGGGRFPVAMTRLLAETAVIQQERPYDARDIFVRFPRDWRPADEAATAALLALPLTTPWLGPTTLPEAVTRPDRATNKARIPRYPQAALRAEVPASALRTGDDLRRELMSFLTILADGEPPPPGSTSADRAAAEQAADAIRERLALSRDAVAWSESAHWRSRPTAAAALRAAVAQSLLKFRGQVFVATSNIRLTSTSGAVPITVVNRLGTPVRVRIKLQSQRFGLTFGGVKDVTVPAAVRAEQPGSASVQIPSEARTVGKFPVDAQLLTVDNVELGRPSTITVNTTAYGRLALAVTAGAFGLLVLASLVRFVLRRRRDGRGGPGDGGHGDDAGGDRPPAEPESQALAPAST